MSRAILAVDGSFLGASHAHLYEDRRRRHDRGCSTAAGSRRPTRPPKPTAAWTRRWPRSGWPGPESTDPELSALILRLQRELFVVGADLATNPRERVKLKAEVPWYPLGWSTPSRAMIDAAVEAHPLPQEFVVPGANPLSAALDVSRTAVRRAERRAVELADQGRTVGPDAIRYLNGSPTCCSPWPDRWPARATCRAVAGIGPARSLAQAAAQLHRARGRSRADRREGVGKLVQGVDPRRRPLDAGPSGLRKPHGPRRTKTGASPASAAGTTSLSTRSPT